jgi:hypothetical protein
MKTARTLSSVMAMLGLVVLAQCGGDSQPRIRIKGSVLLSQFSPDGGHLLVNWGHAESDPNAFPEGTRIRFDMLSVFESGTWRLVKEFSSSGRIWRGYMCADPDIVFYRETNEPATKQELVVRSLATGQEIARKPMDLYLGSDMDNPRGFYCDLSSNTIYMFLAAKKITSLNGSNGEVVREFFPEEAENTSGFIVQVEKDRLIAIDQPGEQVFIFRLSTGELLGKVKVWDADPVPLDHFQDHALVDEDHLLYYIIGEKSNVNGTYFFLVDLTNRSIEDESCIEGYMAGDIYPIQGDTRRILISMIKYDDSDMKIGVFNYTSGTVESYLQLPVFEGMGTMFPVPSEGRLIIDSWDNPPQFAVFQYPGFSMLFKGPAPIAAADKHYVSRGKLLVMSNSRDEFGVYDPVNFKVLDAFRICQNTQYVTRIDPQERWAAVVCAGYPMDTQLKPGQVPDGAGIAIVELDRYR